jgi:hypothetical protein
MLKIFSFAFNNLSGSVVASGCEILVMNNLFMMIGENTNENKKPEPNDTKYPDCTVGPGFQFINDDNLRVLLITHFGNKVKNGVIYVTKPALCFMLLS